MFISLFIPQFLSECKDIYCQSTDNLIIPSVGDAGGGADNQDVAPPKPAGSAVASEGAFWHRLLRAASLISWQCEEEFNFNLSFFTKHYIILCLHRHA